MALRRVRVRTDYPPYKDRMYLVDLDDLTPEPDGGDSEPVTVSWANVTEKPVSFPPSDHDHPDLEAMIWFMS